MFITLRIQTTRWLLIKRIILLHYQFYLQITFTLVSNNNLVALQLMTFLDCCLLFLFTFYYTLHILVFNIFPLWGSLFSSGHLSFCTFISLCSTLFNLLFIPKAYTARCSFTKMHCIYKKYLCPRGLRSNDYLPDNHM